MSIQTAAYYKAIPILIFYFLKNQCWYLKHAHKNEKNEAASGRALWKMVFL